jgi:Protein of unknown function (DUF2630)
VCSVTNDDTSEYAYQGGALEVVFAGTYHTTSERNHMAVATRKTELTPLEAIVVENALGDEARRNSRDGTLARIQLLTKERQKLYARSSAHPLLAPAYGPQIRAMSAQIEQLWDLLRRERATRRVQIERAFNVTGEDEDNDGSAQSGSSDAA